MPGSKFKRPAGFNKLRSDPEEQYRAGYQHGVMAVIEMLRALDTPDLNQLTQWAEIELSKWRHDPSADPTPPKMKNLK